MNGRDEGSHDECLRDGKTADERIQKLTRPRILVDCQEVVRTDTPRRINAPGVRIGDGDAKRDNPAAAMIYRLHPRRRNLSSSLSRILGGLGLFLDPVSPEAL